MTVADTQTLLNTIYTQINGKSGTIYSVSISNGLATVNIDWAAFQDNFAGQSADQTGSIWSKTVGSITYTAKQDNNQTVSSTVPTPA